MNFPSLVLAECRRSHISIIFLVSIKKIEPPMAIIGSSDILDIFGLRAITPRHADIKAVEEDTNIPRMSGLTCDRARDEMIR